MNAHLMRVQYLLFPFFKVQFNNCKSIHLRNDTIVSVRLIGIGTELMLPPFLNLRCVFKFEFINEDTKLALSCIDHIVVSYLKCLRTYTRILHKIWF